MKKKTISIIVILLLAGVANAARISFDEEEKEKQSKPDKTGNQEEPCYDITSTYYGNTGMLAIRFNSTIENVDIYVYKNGEPIIAMENLSKFSGSTEWINLYCYGGGDYTVYIMADATIAGYIDICI